MAKSVLVAMSGGVDSSVTAALLQDQGYQVTGATIKMWPASKADEDARRVADSLGLPFLVLDYQESFRREVIDLFIQEYKLGKTPNPCILCNRAIKFGLLLAEAEKAGIQFVATGHYAKIIRGGGGAKLFRGQDKKRDQSYFLYTLTEDKLKKILFPLGQYSKDQIRELAKDYNLAIADKPDSQEICFLSGQDYKEFLRAQGELPVRPGQILDTGGKVIGRHQGIYNYTIGQRRGLGIADGIPLYVLAIDAASNTVIAGSAQELEKKAFVVSDFNWISGRSPSADFMAEVAIRYNAQPQPARVRALAEGRVRIEFNRPQRAIAPGQAAVVYDGDEVLGGGKICSVCVADQGGGIIKRG